MGRRQGGGSAYNLRLPPKASGKDTGSPDFEGSCLLLSGTDMLWTMVPKNGIKWPLSIGPLGVSNKLVAQDVLALFKNSAVPLLGCAMCGSQGGEWVEREDIRGDQTTDTSMSLKTGGLRLKLASQLLWEYHECG